MLGKGGATTGRGVTAVAMYVPGLSVTFSLVHTGGCSLSCFISVFFPVGFLCDLLLSNQSNGID